MLGDLNLTEEQIDRTLAHLDDVNAIEALRNLHQCLDIEDSWQHAFPHDRCFTYQATNGGQAIKSSLDRIYTSKEVTKSIYNWKFTQMSVLTLCKKESRLQSKKMDFSQEKSRKSQKKSKKLTFP